MCSLGTQYEHIGSHLSPNFSTTRIDHLRLRWTSFGSSMRLCCSIVESTFGLTMVQKLNMTCTASLTLGHVNSES